MFLEVTNATAPIEAANNKTGLPFPIGIYLLNVNNRSTMTSFEICSKLTKKTRLSIWISVGYQLHAMSHLCFEWYYTQLAGFNDL